MRREIGLIPTVIVILMVLALATSVYVWLDRSGAPAQPEPSVTSAIEKLQRLTPEQRREIGRKAEEAAKAYGK